jgi:hypothetical protein
LGAEDGDVAASAWATPMTPKGACCCCDDEPEHATAAAAAAAAHDSVAAVAYDALRPPSCAPLPVALLLF